jgi:hypothetical protein
VNVVVQGEIEKINLGDLSGWILIRVRAPLLAFASGLGHSPLSEADRLIPDSSQTHGVHPHRHQLPWAATMLTPGGARGSVPSQEQGTTPLLTR